MFVAGLHDSRPAARLAAVQRRVHCRSGTSVADFPVATGGRRKDSLMTDVFKSHLEWSGATKGPTDDPRTFSRDLVTSMAGIMLPMSSAPAYRGDPSRVNPEQLFVASLSACQALTYLALAAKHGVSVAAYSDDAEGWLGIVDGKTRMARVSLRPRIVLAPGADEARARMLVSKAHDGCFIGNSVSTPIEISATVITTVVAAE
jgi:organic hydroperoxide reductase OsmC/OhrA